MRQAPIVDDPMERWAKLAWDMRMFRAHNGISSDERALLTHRAILICVTAWSLRLWTEDKLIHEKRRPFRRDVFLGQLRSAVPQQAMCEAIAETARLAYYRDGQWPHDLLRMIWTQPSPNGPGGWALQCTGFDGEQSLPVFAFLRLDRDWRIFLDGLGLSDKGTMNGKR